MVSPIMILLQIYTENSWKNGDIGGLIAGKYVHIVSVIAICLFCMLTRICL